MRRALSRRTILLAATSALLALAWAAAPADALQLSPAEPHSPNAEAMHSTYWVMFVLAIVLIVAINAALIVAVVRFRERRGREAAQVHAGRGALRPVVAALSVLAVAIFVYGVIRTDDVRTVEASGPDGLGTAATTQVGVRGLAAVATSEAATSGSSSSAAPSASGECDTSAANTSPLEIKAIAQQWVWRFEYPGAHSPSDTYAYQTLVVPVDTTVILDITSTDVLHSWFVPSLGGQVQATPGEHVQTWFKADEVGTYGGASTVFSGSSFPAMRSWVKVVTVPEYQDYVQQLCTDIQESEDYVLENEPPASAG
jgi:cytochrome c oxidase subunit 2